MEKIIDDLDIQSGCSKTVKGAHQSQGKGRERLWTRIYMAYFGTKISCLSTPIFCIFFSRDNSLVDACITTCVVRPSVYTMYCFSTTQELTSGE
jgi:hypothetical protein